MVGQQQTFSLSSYSNLYDLIISQDNLLRQINHLIDFSFVYDELINKYCLTNGRKAESPIKMFKYLLLKTIFDVSDVDVVQRSRYDMSFKYFLDMTPEEGVINPSSLTKFRKLRLQDADLLSLLIGKTVEIAIEKEIIKSKSIIVDATHTKSRSNPFSPLEVLKERSKRLRKSIYDVDENLKDLLPQKNMDDDLEHELSYCSKLIEHLSGQETLLAYPMIGEKFNVLKEALEDTFERYTVSKDQDVRVGHKSKDSKFFGYKTHIAMTEERIITNAIVTSGEKGDGALLQALIEDSIKNGLEVETVIGDGAYSGKDNLICAKRENIKISSQAKLYYSSRSKKGRR